MMKIKTTAAFALVIITLFGCNQPKPNPEIEIIAASINNEFGPVTIDSTTIGKTASSAVTDTSWADIVDDRPGKGYPGIVLTRETVTQNYYSPGEFGRASLYLRKELTSFHSICYRDYITKNKEFIVLDSIPGFKAKLHIMTIDNIDKLFSDGGWEKYYETYGEIPLVEVSRPGINKEGNKAFIYYGGRVDGTAGAGYYVIMVKEGGKWIVKEATEAWIS